jgi:GR25 family glycosyltransferase involved in LPS biosynthesis
MRTFVVHYRALVERKQAMLAQLSREGMTAEFVEQYERNTLREEDLGIFVRGRRFPWLRPIISPVQMAITLSHVHCWQGIAGQDLPGLVLEDDAILAVGFRDRLSEYLAELTGPWDMLFPGDGCGLHIPERMRVAGRHVYPKGREPSDWGGLGATRCTDSYVVTPVCARKLLRHLGSRPASIAKPVDHWLNDAIRETGIEVFWAEPTIVTQGSEAGLHRRSY